MYNTDIFLLMKKRKKVVEQATQPSLEIQLIPREIQYIPLVLIYLLNYAVFLNNLSEDSNDMIIFMLFCSWSQEKMLGFWKT